MTILPSPSSVASNCARHPWRVLGVWLLILVAAGVAASGIGGALTTTSNFSNTPESLKGQQLLKDRLTGDTPVTETVIVTSSTATVDDPAFKDVVEKATSDLLALSGVVESASNVYQVEQSDPATAADLVSADRHTTIVPVTLVGPFNEATDHADEYMQTVEQQGGNGFDVLTVGDVSSAQAFNSVASNDLGSAERIALPVTLIVLVIVFSALVAAGMPIVLALVSIVVAVGLTALVGRLLDLNYLVVNMITMIGMAVGIDYSLFIIQRYREERRRGAEKQLAISRAGGTAGKAVLFSGGTVAIALTGMLLVPLTVFHSLGIGAILVVLVALVAMLTLVPAIISLLGDLIEWPRRHRFDAEAVARQQAEDDEVFHQGFWGHVSHFVMNHAVLSVTTAVLVLVLAALPAINLHRGSAGLETLPDSEVKTAYEILSRDFPVGLLAPVQVVIDGDVNDPQVQAATTSLTSALEQDDTFGPATVTRNPANDLTLVSTPLKVDQDSSQATAAVHELRNSIIPHAFDGAPAKVYVTGGPAFNADYFHLIQVATPRVFLFVLGFSFILLMLAFRSIVVPAKAIVMNLLSVGAAYGLLVAVFQKGYLHHLFGFQHTPTVEAWVPIFMFSVLFGLSMDYHVFLLSRIREQYDRTRRNRDSVAIGLQATARVITSAAVIMVIVFASFATGRLVALQQLGFGMAVAVFIDATIIRTVLVPAAMKLLGDVNWYLPRWLAWLPDLRIEGQSEALQAPAQGVGD